ncbi:MAG: thymidine phosphorylase [Roseovarius sp.]|nr:thymidine phosphorylase [Roseovarius sp.]
MDARTVIAGIRDGKTPSVDEIRWFAEGLANGSVSDAQAGAFAMAVLLKGLGKDGRTALTMAMRDSGKCMVWPDDAPVLDKHSTGGIGDCLSLVLAPALAACGAVVPMVSGRGLGHTGGTLDKMEAIPGLSTLADERSIRRIIGDAGCAIVGASDDIAPADRRLYAVRDVSGTVESIDLITASILSKKLSAGLAGLVLDVKAGSGAFMKTPDDALALAYALVETANAAGCKTSAVISDMNQPLASAAGNAVEVVEAMKTLTECENSNLLELCCALGGRALCDSGLADGMKSGSEKTRRAIESGEAANRFGRMVAAMGGSTRFLEDWKNILPAASIVREFKADRAGCISAIDGQKMGLAVIALGGGRNVESDQINPAAGISEILPLGSAVNSQDSILLVHADNPERAARAEHLVRSAIEISDEPSVAPPLVHKWILG